MKKLFAACALLALSSIAFAATTTPVSLLNPAGSTSGQAIVSTGATTPPVWGAVPLTGITGTLAVAHGGTGATSASAALANLGGAALAGATFTGAVSVSNAQSGSSYVPALTLSNSDVSGDLGIYPSLATGNFNSLVITGDAGVIPGIQDQPIVIAPHSANATGLRITTSTAALSASTSVALNSPAIALSSRPTFNGATPWDSANLASPAQTTGAVFTGLITPSSTVGIKGTTTNDNAQTGSIGEVPMATNLSGVSITSGAATNLASVPLSAGDWEVSCQVYFIPAAGTALTGIIAGVNTVSATLPAFVQTQALTLAFTTGVGQVITAPRQHLSLSAASTAYCVGTAAFSTGTVTGNGYIYARRMR